MELLKDYDCTILYHPKKANVVADDLSWKSMGSLAHIARVRRPLIYKLHELEGCGVWFEILQSWPLLAHMQGWSSLVEELKSN